MMRRFTLTLLGALLAGLVHADQSPNFIIIYADDLGYSQLGLSMMKEKPEYGHPLHQTPNLEKLAKRGMRFSNAYAPSPVCTSSRASIQFGKTTARVGCVSLHDVMMTKNKVDMRKETSIAEMLREADKGYHTAFFGKGCTPMGWFKDHGYHETDFIWKHPNGNGHGDWLEPAERTLIPKDDPKRMYSLARTSVKYLEDRAADKKPFFMMISHYALHVRNESLKSTREKFLKIVAEREGIAGGIPDISRFDDNADEMPQKFRHLWARANYAAMVNDMDTSIGMVLDKLKALGLEGSTYVILASDNGGGQNNVPLQGGKAKMWEGGLRTPMIVAGPKVPANSQCDVPVAQWDYLATFHDLAGSKAPLPKDLDGVSLKSLFEKGNAGTLPTRDTGLVFHFPAYYTVPITAYRDGDYKLMRHLNTGEIKLFNLTKDMGEQNDLSKAMPEKVASMVAKLDAYLLKVGAWKMDEVYETRLAELEQWLAKHDQAEKDLRAKLASDPSNKQLLTQMKRIDESRKRHQKTFEQVTDNRSSGRWF
jgi:arylsulfatase A-like enzyme